MAQAAVDIGHVERVTSAEKRKPVELRRKTRVLGIDVKILKRASTYFAKETIVQLLAFRASAARSGPAGLGGSRRLLRRQRADGVVLVDHVALGAVPTRLREPGRGWLHGRRVNRRLLRAPPPPLRYRLPHSRQMRGRAHHGRCCGIITTGTVPGNRVNLPRRVHRSGCVPRREPLEATSLQPHVRVLG